MNQDTEGQAAARDAIREGHHDVLTRARNLALELAQLESDLAESALDGRALYSEMHRALGRIVKGRASGAPQRGYAEGHGQARHGAQNLLRHIHTLRRCPALAKDPVISIARFSRRVDVIARARRLARELAQLESDLAGLPLDGSPLYASMHKTLGRILRRHPHGLAPRALRPSGQEPGMDKGGQRAA